MSRNRTRARKRRAHEHEQHARIDGFRTRLRSVLDGLRVAESAQGLIEANEGLLALIREIEAADVPLWPVAREIDAARPDAALPEEEKAELTALVAQHVAKHLAAMSSVRRRHALGVTDE